MHLDMWQWGFGAAAAILVGISKTGVPGVGILVVPLLAAAFGGRISVGMMLPMLCVGDCFAVLWYRRHAQWDKLIGLFPSVVVGVVIGAITLWAVGNAAGKKDLMNPIIGCLVLAMLGVHLLQGRLGEKLTPKSGIGMIGTGATAGFATTVSNAAGPVMQIYMAAHKLPKEQFMGTIAWYFFIINLSKVPVFAVLSVMNPKNPMMTPHTLLLDLLALPVIIVGVFIGRWMLPKISQAAFNGIVLALSAIYAVKLILG